MTASTETLLKIQSLLAELSADELMLIAKSCQIRAKRLKSGLNQNNTKKVS